MTTILPFRRNNVVYAIFRRRRRLTQPVVFGLLLEWPLKGEM